MLDAKEIENNLQKGIGGEYRVKRIEQKLYFLFSIRQFFSIKNTNKSHKRSKIKTTLSIWIVKTWSCNYLQVVIPHLLCDVPNSNSEKFSSLQWLIDFTYLHRNLFLLFFVIAHLHHFTFHMCSFFCFNLLFSFNLLFFFSFHIHFLVSLHCLLYCLLQFDQLFYKNFCLTFSIFFYSLNKYL